MDTKDLDGRLHRMAMGEFDALERVTFFRDALNARYMCERENVETWFKAEIALYEWALENDDQYIRVWDKQKPAKPMRSVPYRTGILSAPIAAAMELVKAGTSIKEACAATGAKVPSVYLARHRFAKRGLAEKYGHSENELRRDQRQEWWKKHGG